MEAWQILRKVLTHDDQKVIGSALHVSPTRMHSWTVLPERDGGEGALNPIERFCTMVEILRAIGNDGAEELMQYAADRLGYVAYRPTPDSTDDGHMSAVLREMSDALTAKSEGDRDGKWTADEWERLASEMSQVGREAVSYSAFARRNAEVTRAAEKRLPKARPFVRMTR